MALPDFLPIVRDRMAAGARGSVYDEPELKETVDLCDGRGRLNPAAVGWSRAPLVRANLSGHWLRKKRWNFWNWISPRFVLSATVADIDYAAFCEVALTDFESKRTVTARASARPGSIDLPEHVERSIAFRRRSVDYRSEHRGDRLEVALRARARDGTEIAGEWVVARPPGHESLNIVVPWSDERFQMNSKHAALPTAGEVRVGDVRYAMRPEECHAVQDFGRGVWPYVSFWNWAVATGVHDGTTVAVNMGGKWTTGTGVNENGILLGGRLHKVMEDLVWTYDPADWMKPWRVVSPHTGMIDLTLAPVVARSSRISVGFLRSGGVCCFGTWEGRVRVEGGEVELRSVPGWAEEFDHRW